MKYMRRLLFKGLSTSAYRHSRTPKLPEERWRRLLRKAHVPDVELSLREISKLVYGLPKYESRIVEAFEELCQRRCSREPLQYIVGEWDFRHITLVMEKLVFIPRPETEGLVELVNRDIRHRLATTPYVTVFEVGVGSGAVALSILKENELVTCTAIDMLEEAVALTQLNANKLNLNGRLSLHHRNLENISDGSLSFGETKFDILVSNPPYIPTFEIQDLQPEVARFEARVALDGGENGLSVVTEILSKARYLLKPGGSVWLEVGIEHPDLIRNQVSLRMFPDFDYVATHFDFAARPRYCELTFQP